MLKKNKKSKLLILLLLGISSGFAYLTSNLSIFGSSILKGQKWDVHFENVQVSSEGVQIEKPDIIDKTAVEYNITLDKPGDFVEFTVDAKNDGTIDAMISTMPEIKLYDGESEEVLESIPDYLEYSVTYSKYEDIPIEQYYLLKAGEMVTYKVHVGYKKDITNDQLIKIQKTLKAEFNVAYEQADNNAISYNKRLTTESTLSRNKINSFGINNNPTKLIFVNTGVNDSEDEKYTDVSEEQDNSILAWMDEETMYVSAKAKGLYIKMPENCNEFFHGDYVWLGEITKIDASKLDVSNVTDMSSMFWGVGQFSETIELDVSGFDTSNVTNMSATFYNVGWDANSTNIIGLNDFDTSNVTDMSYMFAYVGESSTEWSIGDISNFNTSKVTDMSYMFSSAGKNATNFELNIGAWDTSRVTDMSQMFKSTGQNSNYSLDLSGWNVNNVTKYSDFNNGVTSKVTPPNWVN